MKPGLTIWIALRRHKSGMFGLMVIILLGFMAFASGPMLIDNTEDSNRQIPALPLLKAGERVTVLKMNNGIEEEWIPITECSLRDTVLQCQVIQNADKETIPKDFNVKKVLSQGPSFGHTVRFVLGTDVLGRDIASRMIKGMRISFMVGLMAMIISLFVGVIIGLVAGYYGGKIDDVVMLFINSMWSIPTLLLVFALVLVFGRGMSNIYIAIGLTMWVEIARLTRGLIKKIKEENFVMVAHAFAFSDRKIILHHLLPNIIDPLLVLAATNFATAILVEAGLSYLGFGVQPPTPSLGMILSENYGYVLSGHYWKAGIPALIILLMVLSLNLLGNGLRDVIDVKTK